MAILICNKKQTTLKNMSSGNTQKMLDSGMVWSIKAQVWVKRTS
jgi:hypothetical protein